MSNILAHSFIYAIICIFNYRCCDIFYAFFLQIIHCYFWQNLNREYLLLLLTSCLMFFLLFIYFVTETERKIHFIFKKGVHIIILPAPFLIFIFDEKVFIIDFVNALNNKQKWVCQNYVLIAEWSLHKAVMLLKLSVYIKNQRWFAFIRRQVLCCMSVASQQPRNALFSFLMGSHLHCAWGLSWSLTVCLEVASLVCISSCYLAKCQKFCWMCLGIYFGRSAFPEPMRPIWWRWTLSSQHPVLSQKFMISAFIPNLYLVYWCFHCLVYNSHFLLSNQSSYIVFGMFLPLQISGIELYETTSSHTSLSAFPFPDIPQ